MLGFKTNNSVYYVDKANKKITGGVFGENIEDIESSVILIGVPAVIVLADGRKVTTSPVIGYITA